MPEKKEYVRSRRANFLIVEDDFLQAEPLVIRDVGPWDKHLTVTNDVEDVVRRLVQELKLPPGRRLLYYDTDGKLDEILIEDGAFIGFAPGPEHPEREYE